jgi:hypothetical protein
MDERIPDRGAPIAGALMPRLSNLSGHPGIVKAKVQLFAVADPKRMGNEPVMLLDPLLDFQIANRFNARDCRSRRAHTSTPAASRQRGWSLLPVIPGRSEDACCFGVIHRLSKHIVSAQIQGFRPEGLICLAGNDNQEWGSGKSWISSITSFQLPADKSRSVITTDAAF